MKHYSNRYRYVEFNRCYSHHIALNKFGTLFRVTKKCCISKKYITSNCDWVFYAKKIRGRITSTPYFYSESQKAFLDMTTIKTNPTVRYFSDRSSATFFDYVFQVCEAEEPSTPTCTKTL